MSSIFSTMIEKMIENIDKINYDLNISKEYPTSYHYLISKIFGNIGYWLETFNDDENYDNKSSFIVFFPFCFSLCINQLYKGLQDEKISIDFIKKRFCYDLFHLYFRHNFKKELENEINERCIKDIPKHLIEIIFDYALDDILALNFYTFINSNFTSPASKDFEQERLQSLKTFMSKNNLI